MKEEESIEKAESFVYYDLSGTEQKMKCAKTSIAFTFCQVPFIYRISVNRKIIVHMKNDERIEIAGLELGEKLSQSIFNREGKIRQVEVVIDKKIFKQ